MRPFEELCQTIDEIASEYHKSLIARAVLACEYLYRKHWLNKPIPFIRVNEDEGEPVGEPFDVTHLRLCDMLDHAARGELTTLVMIDGLRINAFSVGRFEAIDTGYGRHMIQPRWVEPALDTEGVI